MSTVGTNHHYDARHSTTMGVAEICRHQETDTGVVPLARIRTFLWRVSSRPIGTKPWVHCFIKIKTRPKVAANSTSTCHTAHTGIAPIILMSMYVYKRSGKRESVHFDKITSRVSKLCHGLNPKVSTAMRSECIMHPGLLLNVVPSLTRHVSMDYQSTACRPGGDFSKGDSGNLSWSHHIRIGRVSG
jgi:hypothetical protein